eukprot:414602-Hanusia_phi.AAC.4
MFCGSGSRRSNFRSFKLYLGLFKSLGSTYRVIPGCWRYAEVEGAEEEERGEEKARRGRGRGREREREGTGTEDGNEDDYEDEKRWKIERREG